MNRDEARNQIKKFENRSILIEHPTGYGKGATAINRAKSVLENKEDEEILIVVNRNVHKQMWKTELDKWWKDRKVHVDLTTYMSLSVRRGQLKKYYDFVICDECHHFTESSYSSFLDLYVFEHIVLLSATVKPDWRDVFKSTLPEFTQHKITLRQAIDNNVLPDPEIHLYPLELNNTDKTEFYDRKKNGKKERIFCTKKAYIERLNKNIEYFKNMYLSTRSEAVKFKWLSLSKDRLIKLSEYKEAFVKKLLDEYKDERTVTFCSNISQTERLGFFCINNKNKDSYRNLDLFNRGVINHITACDMLNEGVNLVNCKIGIFAKLSGSEIIIKQRNGRLLRHKSPIFIIPYFMDTREAELVHKMIEDYNKKNIIIK